MSLNSGCVIPFVVALGLADKLSLSTKGAAVDVDSYADYQEIVAQVLKSRARKMIIWLSLDNVKKAFKVCTFYSPKFEVINVISVIVQG